MYYFFSNRYFLNISRSQGRVGIRPRESLHIAPVDPEDAGVYQCMASSAHDYAHGHAYVILGGK